MGMTTGFNRVIPGQSLTAAPGSMPYEKPPQFVSPDKAMEYLMQNLVKPDSVTKLKLLLESDVPVEGLVRTILFSGMAEGKWTYDLCVLLAKPLAGLVITIAKLAGAKDFRITSGDGKVSQDIVTLMKQAEKIKALKAKDKPTDVATTPAPVAGPPTTGLMGAL